MQGVAIGGPAGISSYMEVHGEGTTSGPPQGRPFDFLDREVVLRADLAARDEDGLIWTPVRFLMRGPRPPRPGELVVLMDIRGSGSCIGWVESVQGWRAAVRPDPGPPNN